MRGFVCLFVFIIIIIIFYFRASCVQGLALKPYESTKSRSRQTEVNTDLEGGNYFQYHHNVIECVKKLSLQQQELPSRVC